MRIGQWGLKSTTKLIFIFAIILNNSVYSFYVPGVAPQDFRKGDPVEVKVKRTFFKQFAN